MAWLLRDQRVLATVEVADTRRARRRGLLGRDDVDGALVLRPCRHVHSLGMRFELDVAFCAADGRVLRTHALRPWRLSPFVPGAAFVIEARRGAFERWELRAGDRVEVRP